MSDEREPDGACSDRGVSPWSAHDPPVPTSMHDGKDNKETRASAHQKIEIKKFWRRERDSNPRYAFTHTRFPSVRLKPLGHLSCARGRSDRGRSIPDAASDANPNHPSIFNAARKADCGISTLPNWRIRFLPSFCFSSSFRLREMSPP